VLKTWLAPSPELSLVLGQEQRRTVLQSGLGLTELPSSGFNRWFLFRRCPEHPHDPNSYYQVSLQATPPKAVGVVGQRWMMFSVQRPAWFGDYEVRFHGRLASPCHFVLAAGLFLSVLRYQPNHWETLNSSFSGGAASLWFAFKACGLSSIRAH